MDWMEDEMEAKDFPDVFRRKLPFAKPNRKKLNRRPKPKFLKKALGKQKFSSKQRKDP